MTPHHKGDAQPTELCRRNNSELLNIYQDWYRSKIKPDRPIKRENFWDCLLEC